MAGWRCDAGTPARPQSSFGISTMATWMASMGMPADWLTASVTALMSLAFSTRVAGPHVNGDERHSEPPFAMIRYYTPTC